MRRTLTSRRHALRVLATTATMPFAACTAATSSEPEPFGDVTAGNLADIPEGTLRPIDGAPAIIGRDARGLYAMTSTCTHQGCDMIADGRVDSSGIVCACHDSFFDRNGKPKSGPAEQPLAHFAVSIDANLMVMVHGAKQVSAATRTAPT